MSRSFKTKMILMLSFFCILSMSLRAQTLDYKTFSRVFKKVSNSVVSIEVNTTQIINGQPKTIESGGSGVIISSDGHIITNKHVVNSQTRTFKVKLANGMEAVASFVGMAPDTDLSLLKLNSGLQNGIEPIALGDSSAVEEGD